MKYFWALELFHLFVLLKICSADQHTFGGILGGSRFYHRKVIDDTNIVPKNYTIIFKYFGKKHPLLSQIIIDVSSNSTGTIQVSNELQNIDAKISVYNALNVTGTISIYGFGVEFKSLLRSWSIDEDEYAVKSYTIVYRKNATQSDAVREFSRNSIGTRQTEDQLIYFESRNVTNASRFPSRAFEYSSDDWITYVGFSFNSPTAMALVNTSFISSKEFSTVVYDMNTEHFVANMSIYGYKSITMPSNYYNLLGDGLSWA